MFVSQAKQAIVLNWDELHDRVISHIVVSVAELFPGQIVIEQNCVPLFVEDDLSSGTENVVDGSEPLASWDKGQAVD
jgi:hypothetical protein